MREGVGDQENGPRTQRLIDRERRLDERERIVMQRERTLIDREMELRSREQRVTSTVDLLERQGTEMEQMLRRHAEERRSM